MRWDEAALTELREAAPAAFREFVDAYAAVLVAGYPGKGYEFDKPRPTSREHPTPGAATSRYRSTLRRADQRLRAITTLLRERLGDPIAEEPHACDACGRPFHRTGKWTATANARDALERALIEGPRTVAEATAEVRRIVHVSERTIREAAKQLDVERVTLPGGRGWRLRPMSERRKDPTNA